MDAEFKEIRKEWKARKKEEDAQRKADEERARAAGGDPHDPSAAYPGARPVQLPPIGYSHQYPAPGNDYGGGHMYSNYTPHSPYGAQTMYNQCKQDRSQRWRAQESTS